MTSSQIPSRIAMPCPFGGFGSNNITPIKTVTGDDVNFPDGFPSAYGAPTDTDGKFVTRKEVNAIGNLASNDLFYHKCGGLNTFDAAFCAQIGGYPKGAVLDYINGNQISQIISIIDNNTINVLNDGVDGINWIFANKDRAQLNLFEDKSINSMSGFTTIGAFVAPSSGVVSVNFDYSLSKTDDSHTIKKTGGQISILGYPSSYPCVMLLDATLYDQIIFPSVTFGYTGIFTWNAHDWNIVSGSLYAVGLSRSSSQSLIVEGNSYCTSASPLVVGGHKYIVGLCAPFNTILSSVTSGTSSDTAQIELQTMAMQSSVEINIV